jgi:hypothetical protein
VVAHPSSKASRTPPAAMGRITRATSALTRPTGDCAPLTTQAMPATPHSVGGNSLALAATTPHPVAEKQTAAKTTARKRNKRQASTKAAAAGAEAPAEVVEATAWPEPSEAVLVGDDATATEVELAAEAPKRRRARRQQDPPPLNGEAPLVTTRHRDCTGTRAQAIRIVVCVPCALGPCLQPGHPPLPPQTCPPLSMWRACVRKATSRRRCLCPTLDMLASTP